MAVMSDWSPVTVSVLLASGYRVTVCVSDGHLRYPLPGTADSVKRAVPDRHPF